MKGLIGEVVCYDLNEVCEEVKRQLRQGNKVEVCREYSSPVLFMVSFGVNRIPTTYGDGEKRVTGYFGQ